MQKRFINAYMDIAKRFSEESTAVRKKVAAILVKDDNIISIGINGTPKGWSNSCEFETNNGLQTKPEVLHAELNCLSKIAKSTNSSEKSTMFITLSPCYECSKQIYAAGIKRVYYSEDYRNKDGLFFLEKAGVHIEKI